MLIGVSFDVDGVILNSPKKQLEWFRYWSNSPDSKVPGQELNSFLFEVNDLHDWLDFYNHHISKEGGVQNVYNALGLACDMRSKKHPVWKAYLDFSKGHNTEVYDGVSEVIKTIWENTRIGSDYMQEHHPNRHIALRFGINTTNSKDAIFPSIKKANLLQYFDSIITRDELDKFHGYDGDPIKKPSGIQTALLAGAMNSGTSLVHIGDSLSDLVSARYVQMPGVIENKPIYSIGVTWGFSRREELEQGAEIRDGVKVHFDKIIDSPSELPEIIYQLL